MDNIKKRIKGLMVENLMLPIGADQIQDDSQLFGLGGLGLDSVDALQLVVALDKTFGLRIADPSVARATLATVNSMAAAVEQHLTTRCDPCGGNPE